MHSYNGPLKRSEGKRMLWRIVNEMGKCSTHEAEKNRMCNCHYSLILCLFKNRKKKRSGWRCCRILGKGYELISVNPQICKHSYYYSIRLQHGWIYPRSLFLNVSITALQIAPKRCGLTDKCLSISQFLWGQESGHGSGWVIWLTVFHELQSECWPRLHHWEGHLGRGHQLPSSLTGCPRTSESPLPSLLTRLLAGFSSLRAAGPRTSGSCRLLAGAISFLSCGPFHRAARHGSWLPSEKES